MHNLDNCKLSLVQGIYKNEMAYFNLKYLSRFCWYHVKNIASYQDFSKTDNNELRTGKNCHKCQEDLSFEATSKRRYVESLQNYDCYSGRRLRTFWFFCDIMQLKKI